MARRKRTDNTMARRKRTENTMARRKRTKESNNGLQSIHIRWSNTNATKDGGMNSGSPEG
jgi:hypothetical protein